MGVGVHTKKSADEGGTRPRAGGSDGEQLKECAPIPSFVALYSWLPAQLQLIRVVNFFFWIGKMQEQSMTCLKQSWSGWISLLNHEMVQRIWRQ